jgi:hypothetical protein
MRDKEEMLRHLWKILSGFQMKQESFGNVGEDIKQRYTIQDESPKTVAIIYYTNYLVNSINKKMAPDTPKATIKPFQKSVKKSLFTVNLLG